MGRRRLLWIMPYVPLRGRSGTHEYLSSLLAQLSDRLDVVLLAMTSAGDPEAPPPPGVVRLHVLQKAAAGARDRLRTMPRQVAWDYSDPRLREAVGEVLRRERYDLVQVDYTELGYLLPPPIVPTVLTVHQLMFAAEGPSWRAEEHTLRRGALALHRYLRNLDFELRVATRVHRVVTLTSEDASRLRRFHPALPVRVIPAGVDGERFRPPAAAPPHTVDVLLVGHFGHAPNVDAARFLVEEVVPRVGRPVRVRLVGTGMTPEVAALTRPGVEVVADAPDVRSHLVEAATVAAPVRFGTGMRVKVLEAMAMGRPVVSTRLGAEGLGATSGRHLLLADNPVGFAAAVRRLLDDPAAAEEIGAAGRALVTARYGWPAIADTYLALYDEMVTAPGALRALPIDPPPALMCAATAVGRPFDRALGVAYLALRGIRWHLARGTGRIHLSRPPPCDRWRGA